MRVTRLAIGCPSVLRRLSGSRPAVGGGHAGRCRVTDRGTLTHIARTLAIPPHMLGIAGPNDTDFLTMLAFGTSVIRLADAARHGGRAADAVSELWPLITRLEAHIAVGQAEPETMRLLAQARLSFGVALGHLLSEEQLATAARWTGRALRIAWDLDDATAIVGRVVPLTCH